ncbi:phosphoethanolamine transferase CptA [Pseudomonas capeferrum]|uniref:phosphoethanolamine transferase CptA n=1 Tax=Pseudomonas capeferrum TaxID=1495066 RepID=UPI0015E4007E|nr:phosphoethanolamine transferase CptA [Pseudomonas capeferrum]MBA1200193.1 phosphoethanolamine transferase CptA [Pseudomonas capeferrum]
MSTPAPPVQRRSSVRSLAWMYLFFWYFSGPLQILIFHAGVASLKGFWHASAASLLWLIPPLLFPRWTRPIAGITGLVLWMCSLTALAYFLIYGQEFSQSAIFIMFESNVSESSEYLSQYFSWSKLAALIAYSLVAFGLWLKVRPAPFPGRAKGALCLLIAFASVGYSGIHEYRKRGDLDMRIGKFQQKLQSAAPWQLVIGYAQYRQQLSDMASMFDNWAVIAPLQNLLDTHAGQPATLVLVIGESTDRQRMSLYGYPRQTTPELDALRPELDVFDKVVSPRPYTIEVLQQVLTFADQENPELYLTTPSLISVMKQAGYKTYWITNQQTMTQRNTMLTTFSKQADEQVYLNNNRDQNSTSQYDEDVLEPFGQILNDKAPRKLIVVHLLGTHMDYRYRFPEQYARFQDSTLVPDYVVGKKLRKYNDYDNAVLYNDHVVSSLISRFKHSDPHGFLLYLSDHGESVYDPTAPHMLGRSEAAPSRPMYRVPFLLWRSPSWKEGSPLDLQGALHREYTTSHFMHTWADLAGLRFDTFQPWKSLVNPEYRRGKLLIGDPHQSAKLRDFNTLGSAP